MKQEIREDLEAMAQRPKAFWGAVGGLLLLTAAHQIRAGTLFGLAPPQRVFFILNFVASAMLVFGLAGVISPDVFTNMAKYRSHEPWFTMKTIPFLGVAFLAVLLACLSLVVWYVRA